MPVLSHRQALLMLKQARRLARALDSFVGSRSSQPEFDELDSILTALIAHETKAAHGEHRPNPLVIYGNPPGGVISEEVHQIKYRHAENGKPFEHKFDLGVLAIAQPDGSVLLKGDSGQPLWEDM